MGDPARRKEIPVLVQYLRNQRVEQLAELGERVGVQRYGDLFVGAQGVDGNPQRAVGVNLLQQQGLAVQCEVVAHLLFVDLGAPAFVVDNLQRVL